MCGATWIGYTAGVVNFLTCFQPNLLDDQLVFCFQSRVSGQVSALMLEYSFLRKEAELTCSDPEFERFLLRVYASDAMFSYYDCP